MCSIPSVRLPCSCSFCFTDRHILRVVSVEYGPGLSTVMRQVYQTTLPLKGIALFVHADVVGVIIDTPSQLSMLAVNIVTDVIVTIPVEEGDSVRSFPFIVSRI